MQTVSMTQQPASGTIPALTLGWRLRMALDHSDTTVQEMADTLGVARATLSRWMSDKGARPKKAYISQWALKTGVPELWLTSGRVTPEEDPDGGGNGVIRAFLPDLLAPVVTIRQSERPIATNFVKTA